MLSTYEVCWIHLRHNCHLNIRHKGDSSFNLVPLYRFCLAVGSAAIGSVPFHSPCPLAPSFSDFLCDPGVLVADFLPCNIPARSIEGRGSVVTDVELYRVSFRSFLLAAPESFFCLGLFLEVKSPPSLGILV